MTVASLALAASGSVAAQSARDPGAALGRTLAATAQSAERGAPDADSVQPMVRLAVERAIIAAAVEPQIVLAALDSALAACRPASGRMTPEWTCPSSPGSYLALSSLRVVVVAQLEQTDPAALRTPGTSAFGSVMITAPSANYNSL